MKRENIILLAFVVVKLAMHLFLIHPVYDLHRDEYLHLDQAHHLAWGYESVPPFTSWISWLIWKLGNSVFWVKFFPALFGALTIVVVWKTIEALNGNLFARALGATAVLLSVVTGLNILYQPNSFDVLSWTLLYYAWLRYFQSNNEKWLWVAAAVFALGFLNKYNICFLVIGWIPALLMSKYRIVFSRRTFWLAAVLALLLISPNLIWQVRNQLPVIHHMHELARTQLVNVNRLDFLKEQALYFIGSLFLLVVAFVGFFFYGPFKKYQVFFWSYLFTMAIFLYLRAKGYYAIGLYPILLAFGATYLEKISRGRWKWFIRPVALVILVVTFVPFLKVGFPIFPPAEVQRRAEDYRAFGMLRWEDGKDHALPQDFADMLGWRELAAKVDSAYDLAGNDAQTLVLCDNYGQAGAVNYYSKHKNIHAVSMNADYINWIPVNEMQITDVIRVAEADPDPDVGPREHRLFKTITPIGKIENTYARECGTVIYLLQDPTTSINEVLKKEIVERKSRND